MPGPVIAMNDSLYPAAPSEADAPDEGGEVVEIKHPEGYRTEAQLRAEAKTLQHMMSHLPKNPFCPHCQRAKMENVRLHRRAVPTRMNARNSVILSLLTRWCYTVLRTVV